MSDVYNGVTIVTGQDGPPGMPAKAGVALSFSNGYHANEVLPGDVVSAPISITVARSHFRSRTKPTSVVTFPLFKNTVQIGAAMMDPATCGAGPVFNGTVALTADPTQLSDGDLVDWQAPATIDATFVSGAVILGGGA